MKEQTCSHCSFSPGSNGAGRGGLSSKPPAALPAPPPRGTGTPHHTWPARTSRWEPTNARGVRRPRRWRSAPLRATPLSTRNNPVCQDYQGRK
eukprot:scaffold5609_cov135-Isochrysis_galbana.AAC.3